MTDDSIKMEYYLQLKKTSYINLNDTLLRGLAEQMLTVHKKVVKSALVSVGGSCIVNYLEWRGKQKKENRGGTVMYDIKGHHMWLTEDEVFEHWKRENNYR